MSAMPQVARPTTLFPCASGPSSEGQELAAQLEARERSSWRPVKAHFVLAACKRFADGEEEEEEEEQEGVCRHFADQCEGEGAEVGGRGGVGKHRNFARTTILSNIRVTPSNVCIVFCRTPTIYAAFPPPAMSTNSVV